MTAGNSARTPQQALAALLDLHSPQRLLVLGASRFPALDAFEKAHPQSQVSFAAPGALPADLAAQRFDLALVVDCLELVKTARADPARRHPQPQCQPHRRAGGPGRLRLEGH